MGVGGERFNAVYPRRRAAASNSRDGNGLTRFERTNPYNCSGSPICTFRTTFYNNRAGNPSTSEGLSVAEVRLESHPREEVIGRLPRVCMKCGAPATTAKVTQFGWYPPWVLALLPLGVLPFLVVVVIITKRQRVKIPFCEAHKNHFFLGRVLRALGWLGFLGAPALFVIGIVADPKNGRLPGLLCVGWIVLILLYFAAVRVFALLTKIRPTEITDTTTTLTNVSADFVRAREEEDMVDEDDAWDRRDEKRRPDRRANDDRLKPGEGQPPTRSTDVPGEEPE